MIAACVIIWLLLLFADDDKKKRKRISLWVFPQTLDKSSRSLKNGLLPFFGELLPF